MHKGGTSDAKKLLWQGTTYPQCSEAYMAIKACIHINDSMPNPTTQNSPHPELRRLLLATMTLNRRIPNLL